MGWVACLKSWVLWAERGCSCLHAAIHLGVLAADPQVRPSLPLPAPDWSGGVAAVAAALGPGVALKSWSAPLLASHADDFRGAPGAGGRGTRNACGEPAHPAACVPASIACGACKPSPAAAACALPLLQS